MDLRTAIQRGEETLAFRMVWNGANPNEVYDEEDPESGHRRVPLEGLSTPLLLAARRKYEMLAGVLLLKGARVDHLTNGEVRFNDRIQGSPLWHAVTFDYNTSDDDGKLYSGLVRMLVAGEPDELVPLALKRLLRGWYIAEELDYPEEEYHAAIRAIVELKPGAVNGYLGDGDAGFSPLHYVRDRETLEILVRSGANIDSRTASGMSPLSNYTGQDYNVELAVVQSFLEHGADPNAMNNYGYTILMYAAHKDDDEIIDALLRWGADETIVGKDGMTAADCARLSGYEEIVQLLVNAPVDRRWRRRSLVVMCIARIERTGVVASNEDHLTEFLRDTNDCHQGIFRRIIGFL